MNRAEYRNISLQSTTLHFLRTNTLKILYGLNIFSINGRFIFDFLEHTNAKFYTVKRKNGACQ